MDAPVLDERVTLAFEFAKEIATQLITLSIGFLALTITFTKELVARIPRGGRGYLLTAWGLHVLSIVFGVMTLMGLTGALMPVDISTLPSDWSKWTFNTIIRSVASLQLLAFAAGTAAMVAYAWQALKQAREVPAAME